MKFLTDLTIVASAVLFAQLVSAGTQLVPRIAGDNNFDNKKYAAALKKQAIVLPRAHWAFQNVATGRWMAYNRDNGKHNLVVNSTQTPGYNSFNSIAIEDAHIAYTQLKPTKSGNKCLSAAWSTFYDHNWVAQLYKCCPPEQKNCDNNPDVPPLRWEKQAWLVVPANASSIPPAAQAARAWRWWRRSAHPRDFLTDVDADGEDEFLEVITKDADDVKPTEEAAGEAWEEVGDYENWEPEDLWEFPEPAEDQQAADAEGSSEESASELDRRQVKKRAPAATPKRLPGSYYVIPVDHILDQRTRAVGDTTTFSYGGYISLVLEELDERDTRQQWYIGRIQATTRARSG